MAGGEVREQDILCVHPDMKLEQGLLEGKGKDVRTVYQCQSPGRTCYASWPLRGLLDRLP